MKTKKFFMLLAVVLLSGASAFAQSESETLKGDVNEDGVVDVADINAVIEIMKAGGGVVEPPTYYFSVGTTPVTVDNYTTVNNATQEIPAEPIVFWNNSGAKSNVYVLVPSNKTITIVDASIQSPYEFTEDTSVTITNHKVYKTTARIANGGGIKITLSDVQPTYYFSVGTTAPDASNYTTVNNATTTIPASTEYTNNSGSRTYVYILVPENKTVSVKDKNLGGTGNVTEYTDVSITNHKVYKTTGAVANTGTIIITLSDVQPTYYYFYVGQSNPMNMTSISNPLPADNVVDGGWRSLGVTTDQPLPTYTSSNPLWDGSLNKLIVGSSKATCYVALPSPNLKMRDSEGDEFTWINLGEKIFNGVAYTIYESPMQTKVFNNIIF